MQDITITDRRFQWYQRAARYLLEAMGGEFDSWGGVLSHHRETSDRVGSWMWFKILNRMNVIPTEDFVEVFWPLKKKLGRYFTNHLWDVCSDHREEE